MKTLCLLLAVILAFNVHAAGGRKSDEIPITQNIYDYDGNDAPYSLQSDGGGVYEHEPDDTFSMLMVNGFNGREYADRVLQLAVPGANVRNIAITFSRDNEVVEGDPGFIVPANPP